MLHLSVPSRWSSGQIHSCYCESMQCNFVEGELYTIWSSGGCTFLISPNSCRSHCYVTVWRRDPPDDNRLRQVRNEALQPAVGSDRVIDLSQLLGRNTIAVKMHHTSNVNMTESVVWSLESIRHVYESFWRQVQRCALCFLQRYVLSL
jgi:hypothetical protein